MLKKIAFAALTASILTACGGGSKSEDTALVTDTVPVNDPGIYATCLVEDCSSALLTQIAPSGLVIAQRLGGDNALNAFVGDFNQIKTDVAGDILNYRFENGAFVSRSEGTFSGQIRSIGADKVLAGSLIYSGGSEPFSAKYVKDDSEIRASFFNIVGTWNGSAETDSLSFGDDGRFNGAMGECAVEGGFKIEDPRYNIYTLTDASILCGGEPTSFDGGLISLVDGGDQMLLSMFNRDTVVQYLLD